MKTTVEVADALLAEAKQLAAERNWSLRNVIEESLRQFLESAKLGPVMQVQLQHATYGDPGTTSQARSWAETRDLIYGLSAAGEEPEDPTL
jgi:transposase